MFLFRKNTTFLILRSKKCIFLLPKKHNLQNLGQLQYIIPIIQRGNLLPRGDSMSSANM